MHSIIRDAAKQVVSFLRERTQSDTAPYAMPSWGTAQPALGSTMRGRVLVAPKSSMKWAAMEATRSITKLPSLSMKMAEALRSLGASNVNCAARQIWMLIAIRTRLVDDLSIQ